VRRIPAQYLARFLLVALVGAFLYAILRPGSAAPILGKTTPDFQLMDLEGRKIQLSAYRGKVVVLNFWATWCPPCVEEMPSLNRLQETFGSQGVVVLAVSVDEDEQALRRFVAERQLRMVVARDPSRGVSARYQTFQFPETYILDRDGRLERKIVGAADWSDPRLTSFFKEAIR
jgi:peroxiredoxin